MIKVCRFNDAEEMIFLFFFTYFFLGGRGGGEGVCYIGGGRGASTTVKSTEKQRPCYIEPVQSINGEALLLPESKISVYSFVRKHGQRGH